ncbi:ABC transporter permease [Paenibacillus sp. GSMTC-2017]|uniref:ABC transporter permease n=1 Tax=Paenibacillus sp. GSMTC-2017 TaxID=2794350 RepID=UPI0018D62674|nr:ABC transporter permease [Paenibacillus sp. GSMTC-2017]MBH5318617.1 ABC transporter permease [Paenibacillus sp. GSMTC-2017]
MIGRVIRSDLLKLRGKGIWFLIMLGPVGLVAMQGLNFGLRYEYLKGVYKEDLWGGLLENISMFVPIALGLGATILCSLLANIEHQRSSWKQLLALPISRSTVLCSKFVITVLLLAVSCVLLFIGIIILGLGLKFGGDIPLGDIAQLSFFPFAAAMPVMALLLWLCMVMKNHTLPITLGVLMSIFSMFPLPDWMPLKWPSLAYYGTEQLLYIGAGIGCGLVVLLLGNLHFNRKDVG